ncbi:MAG TPA: GNAT family N-acetyltransferase [Baekduia sp.]|uniref:GNAT family N-acetyltransferase n=1 Tax=Baekduia sp. TaxID=2600305 RepID=UPI002D7739D1|nr:GNAT family N-acetyltransferase [Baekduia sp.]HET6509763.1 GNAT family N-acetyltransferase [Baekduia sp.]
MTAATITLRPAGDDDTAFFAALYASTREEELAPTPMTREQKDAFLAQQFAAQTAHYARSRAGAAFDVVLVDGERAGRLIVDEQGDGEIGIVDISLLPAHRGHGVGTRLLAPILERAEALGRPVGIHVERFNPARRLYERLGFAVVDGDGVYDKMVWSPSGAARDQPKTAS